MPVCAGEKDNRGILHGLQLAHRIGGQLSILEIDQVESLVVDGVVSTPKTLQLMEDLPVAQTFEEEVRCEYFQVKGDFYAEVMRFCLQRQITTLVLEISSVSRKASPNNLLQMIGFLQAKKVCRVELIGKK